MLPLTERMLARMAKDQEELGPVGIVLVQHLLADTEEFIRLLQGSGLEVVKVVGIEYSARNDVVEQLRSAGLDVAVPPFAEMERVLQEFFLTGLSGNQSTRIVLQEVGGYCADLLESLVGKFGDGGFAGIVEETKQGLWRYRKLPFVPIPVMEIADSFLKGLEAGYVGEAVARAVETDLLEVGSTLWGAGAVVFGFGEIGSAAANALRIRGGIVSCFDPDSLKLIDARTRGFRSPSRQSLLRHADVIVGASGKRSLSREDLEQLRDCVMLASASSKDIEFPVDVVRGLATSRQQLTPFVSEYSMPWGKRIRIASEGYPINFRGFSLPHFMSDLLFAQITASMHLLLTAQPAPGLQSLSAEILTTIASEWLDVYR